MAKFVFDNCCFCVDLRVGSFIIGYINLIGSVIATIGSILIVASGAVITATTDEHNRPVGVALLVVGIITLIIVADLPAFAIVLLVGLHKNKPRHVNAYLIYCYIFLIISLIMLIVNLATGPYDGSLIASRVVGLLFSTYFVMVIRSYYYQMLESPAYGTPSPPHYNA